VAIGIRWRLTNSKHSFAAMQNVELHDPGFGEHEMRASSARLRFSWRDVAGALSTQWGKVETHLVGGRGGNGERSHVPGPPRRLERAARFPRPRKG
jgi:hypothetical protein